MRNIIVIAYQLHYSKGSEYAVAWNYIQHMSKTNHLTVLYGTCDGHHNIGNTAVMKNYTSKNSIPNVTFIPVKPSFESQNWDFSLKGIKEFYKEYRLWHEDVYRVVCDLIEKEKYDLIHFLGPIGFNEPGMLYNLPIPYIWGPIGGMGDVPLRLLLSSGKKNSLIGAVKLIIKGYISLWRLNHNKRIKNALKQSDVVIGATSEYTKNISNAVGKNHHSIVQYLPENCMNVVYPLNYDKFKSETINLIFIGWLETRKAPMILLEAIAMMGENIRKFHIDFLGEGPMRNLCESFCIKKGLTDIVTFHGRVDREEVFNKISNAHLMLLPSLIDANTTVVWEAMSHAVPTLCLDHCGMHDTIKEGSGIKIPIGSWGDVVNHIKDELSKIANNPEKLKDMAEQLLKDRDEYTWDSRTQRFEEIYSLAEKQFKLR